MKSFFTFMGFASAALALVPHKQVRAEPISQLEQRTSLDFSPKGGPIHRYKTRQTCTNGPTTRNCWSDGFDINTNPYTTWPDTGNVVTVDLSITNTTCNPDGHGERVCMLVNNQLPGPTIYANWGDTLRITVHNLLEHNGTSIHWHGLRQLNSNIQDGTNGITECALAPQDTKTYEFRVTEYGTSWYHSHFSDQYGDGVIGTIVVNGPATANYDEDLGTYTVQDWYYITAFQAGAIAQLGGAPPVGDNILVNGTNKDANGNGAYGNVTLTSGKSYRLRLVNTAIDAQLLVSLDNHPFTVIASDFVAVKPFTVNWLNIGIGQRYDVIINANQTSGNYWFRAEANSDCQSANSGAGRSIFTYANTTLADPTSTAFPTPAGDGCLNTITTPNVALDVPATTFIDQAKTLPVQFEPVQVGSQNIVLWTVNGSSMSIDPGKPTLEYIAEGNTSFPPRYNVINAPPANQWSYWIIQQADGAPPIAHPIHLHGHDFYILGTGKGTFDADTQANSLNYTNPPRRDVAFLPGSGWLVLAYPTDNPGAWLMHCHIAFHVSMGLSVQFLERQSEITLPTPGSEWYNTCQNWANYQNSGPVWPQDDSGLRKFRRDAIYPQQGSGLRRGNVRRHF